MKAKKLSKRIIASVVAAMLVIGCFILPSTIVGAADETTVVFHYLRDDGDYTDWGLWAWGEGSGATYNNGEETSAFYFTDNGDAKGAETTVSAKDVSKLGFIVRKGNWLAKDPESDRFLDLSGVVSGTVHVYCKTGVEEYETDFSQAKLGLKLKSAKADSETVVSFELTAVPGDNENITKDDFSVVSLGGQEVAVSDLKLDGATGLLTLSGKMNFKKEYRLNFKDSGADITLPDIYSSEEFESKYSYLKDDLGANYSAESTTFRVWAPTAKKLELNLYENGDGGEPYNVVEMNKSVRGTWVYTVEGDLNKVYYTYNAYFDGKTNKDIVDPYARTVGVNGKRGMVIDLDSTDPEGWDSDSRHTYPNVTDMSIYELHIRDFSVDPDSGITNKGKYIAFTENGTTTSKGAKTGIDYLKDLGVTTVHILPSYDYGSVDETKLDTPQFNWGYDPVNYNAPEGSYSTDPYHGEVRVKEYKQMVKALHDAGIGVVMDVVYNHTYNTSYCFNQLVPGYFYRPDSNGSGCGNDVATERVMVSKFISDSVKYWADEYHLDGFRFDLMGLIDVDTMNNTRKAVDTIDRNIIIYGEGWTLSTNPTKEGTVFATQKNSELTPGIAYFSDTIRDAIRGHVFTDTDPGYAAIGAKVSDLRNGITYSKRWSKSPLQTVNYDSCHDNHTFFDRLANTAPESSFEDRVKMNKLGAAVTFTSQGIPFMMSGEEFLREKLNEDGSREHNSHASPDSVNQLDYNRAVTYSDVYEYYKGLIEMRKYFSELRMISADAVDNNLVITDTSALNKKVIAYSIKGSLAYNSRFGEEAHDMYVIFNPLTEAVKLDLPEGKWSVVANGEKAGTAVLATAEGNVEVAPISAMVLVKDYDGPTNTFLVDVLKDEATSISAIARVGQVGTLEVVKVDPTVENAVAQYEITCKAADGTKTTFDYPVEIKIPEEKKNLKLLHIKDNGDSEEIRTSYDNETGEYVFCTNSFSTFALVSTPADAEPVYNNASVQTVNDEASGVSVTGFMEDGTYVVVEVTTETGDDSVAAKVTVTLKDKDGNVVVTDEDDDYIISIPYEGEGKAVLRVGDTDAEGEDVGAKYEEGAFTFETNAPAGTYAIVIPANDDPTDPTDDPTNPTDDPTNPADDPTDPTDPTDEPTDPTDEPTDPTDDPTNPTDDPTDPTDDPTNPADNPKDPTDNNDPKTVDPIDDKKPDSTKDTNTPDDNKANGTTTNNVPKTGDIAMASVFTIVAAAAAYTAFVAVKRKKREE